jgi:hypothetical protein
MLFISSFTYSLIHIRWMILLQHFQAELLGRHPASYETAFVYQFWRHTMILFFPSSYIFTIGCRALFYDPVKF